MDEIVVLTGHIMSYDEFREKVSCREEYRIEVINGDYLNVKKVNLVGGERIEHIAFDAYSHELFRIIDGSLVKVFSDGYGLLPTGEHSVVTYTIADGSKVSVMTVNPVMTLKQLGVETTRPWWKRLLGV